MSGLNWKIGITMFLLGFCGGIVGGYVMMNLTHKALSAEQFILADKKGRIHAMLGTTNLGTASMGIWDDNGKNRVLVGFVDKGMPGIGLNDAAGNRRADVMLSAGGNPDILFYDASGNVIWSATKMSQPVDN